MSETTLFTGPHRPMSDDERKLRLMLALYYSGNALYGDDGELQDGQMPFPIDYMRMTVAEISEAMHNRGMLKLAEQQRQAAAEATARRGESHVHD